MQNTFSKTYTNKSFKYGSRVSSNMTLITVFTSPHSKDTEKHGGVC